MMGTCEEVIEDINKVPENVAEVVDDFDINAEEVSLQNREENVSKIERRGTLRYMGAKCIATKGNRSS